MKFFDLEMSSYLAGGKRGGRSVSYTQYNEIYCFKARYTNGNSMGTCEIDKFKTSASQCQMTEEDVHVHLHND